MDYIYPNQNYIKKQLEKKEKKRKRKQLNFIDFVGYTRFVLIFKHKYGLIFLERKNVLAGIISLLSSVLKIRELSFVFMSPTHQDNPLTRYLQLPFW